MAVRGPMGRSVMQPGTDPIRDPYGAAASAAEALAAATGRERHDLAIVLGSGWKPAGDRLGEVVTEVDLADLVGFPASTVAGHGSTVRSIRSGDRRILAFMGRVHLYEGNHPRLVTHAVRTAVLAGCRTVVLTNAAGGLREGMAVGDPVLVADHLNLTGQNPLAGPNDDRLGPRFPDMTEAYSARLRALAREADTTLTEGVYCGFAGPTYETPAEVRMAGRLGADLVGMSTVLEAIAVRHAGAELLAMSLVTNLAAGLGAEALVHEDVLAVAGRSAERMGALIAGIVDRI
jgi:purine-nucleoside phosphorylase